LAVGAALAAAVAANRGRVLAKKRSFLFTTTQASPIFFPFELPGVGWVLAALRKHKQRIVEDESQSSSPLLVSEMAFPARLNFEIILRSTVEWGKSGLYG
jgi:hypothetical protein